MKNDVVVKIGQLWKYDGYKPATTYRVVELSPFTLQKVRPTEDEPFTYNWEFLIENEFNHWSLVRQNSLFTDEEYEELLV